MIAIAPKQPPVFTASLWLPNIAKKAAFLDFFSASVTQIFPPQIGPARAAPAQPAVVSDRDKLTLLVAMVHARYGGTTASWVGPRAGHAVLQSDASDSLIGVSLHRSTSARIPRFARLTAEERAHESAFADQVEADWGSTVSAFCKASWDEELHTFIFETDAAKKLYAPYGTSKAPQTANQARVRATANHALHPTAVAIARASFLRQLDALAQLAPDDPRRSVFVTNGGCAACKGNLCKLVASLHAGRFDFGAVWDAAGEGEGRENPWVLEACRARGLKVTFGYCDNDPLAQYEDVLGRALAIGRIVDVITYARSYTRGASNMRAFLASPGYRAMHATGDASAIGINPGKFDTRHLRDETFPAYPHARILGHAGLIEARDITTQPSESRIVRAAMEQLDRWRKTHADPRWLTGAALNTFKFSPVPRLRPAPTAHASAVH